MEFSVKPIHDFLAFLACLAIGIIASFTQPLIVSLAVFILCYSLWLLLTSRLVKAEYRTAVNPGVARASLGGILLLVSTLLLAISVNLDPRYTALVFIALVATICVYVYYLSRKAT